MLEIDLTEVSMDRRHRLVIGQEAFSQAVQINVDLPRPRSVRPPGTLQRTASFTENADGKAMRAVEQIGLDDVTVRAMGQAFDIACSRLIRAGVLDTSNIERMQRLAAKHLVHCARRGERDEWRLARRAMFLMCMAAANDRLANATAARPLAEAV